jgi:uncharacterized damage-inducible protein DinB
MENIFYKEFIEQSLYRMGHNTVKIKSCVNALDEKEVWFCPNTNLNSVGNLILHLCGNIRQYIISSLGGGTDTRERDVEFSTTGGYGKAELAAKLDDTVTESKSFIEIASHENLLRSRIVQGMPHTGIGIIIHVTEHYSYHTGQIIFLTKLLKNIDLGFYSGIDLNKRNSPESLT